MKIEINNELKLFLNLFVMLSFVATVGLTSVICISNYSTEIHALQSDINTQGWTAPTKKIGDLHYYNYPPESVLNAEKAIEKYQDSLAKQIAVRMSNKAANTN